MIAAVCLLLAFCAGALSLERYGSREPPGGSFDAIVVAGCRVLPGGRPSRALRRRAAHGARLLLEGRAPRLVLTGGVGEHGPSEARVAAGVVRALGIPEAAILLEERSTSTEGNARGARARLEAAGQLGQGRVLVVTDAYHVLRAERVFARYFEVARGVGSNGAPWTRTRGALREVLALAGYGLLGRL